MARNHRSPASKKADSLRPSPGKSSRARKRGLAKEKAEKKLERMSLAELYEFVEAKEQEQMAQALLRDDPLAEARRQYLERAKAIVASEFASQPTRPQGAKKSKGE